MRRATAILRKTRYHPPPRTISSKITSSPTVQITALSNKIRVATDNRPSHFSSVGLFVNAGTRHETLETSGVCHFLDRMAFKVNHVIRLCLCYVTHYKIYDRAPQVVLASKWL
jgi:mitochondrial-processing peptidase subunit alpha